MNVPDRRIVFYGGKGGVGKTTLASAHALHAADGGRRTLLVSTDPAHSTADILETPLGPDPTQVTEYLWAVELDPEREALHYIEDVKARIADTTPPRLAAEVDRQIDIARLSPGAEESAVFDRITRLLTEDASAFERIVFDTAPTGHTLRLLSLPETMTAWMSGLIARRRKLNVVSRMWRNVAGAAAGSDTPRDDPVLTALEDRRRRFAATRILLTDPGLTAFVFVVIPERLPILETERALIALDRYRIPVGGIIVNRLLPESSDGAFITGRREREATYRDRIAKSFSKYPMVWLDLRPGDVVGLDALREIAHDLMPSSRSPSPAVRERGPGGEG
jgi:arsenite-transporting ATPase